MRVFLSLVLISLFISEWAFSQGGPPLVTDDPGTPGDGHWEINTALQWESDQASVIQLPLFDINYGYGDHLQLNLNMGYITVPSTSGFSLASLATKWRFLDEDTSGIAISIYPRIDFHSGLSSSDPLVNPVGSRTFFPIEFSKEFGRFGVNPEIGYATYSQLSSEWSYGLAMSYAFEKDREILFEIHDRLNLSPTDNELLYNFGLRYSLNGKISFIGSTGKIVEAYPGEPFSWNVYLGFQLRL